MKRVLIRLRWRIFRVVGQSLHHIRKPINIKPLFVQSRFPYLAVKSCNIPGEPLSALPRSPKHLIVTSRKWWAVCFGTLETPLKDSSWVSKRADALTNNSERQWGQKRIAFFLPWSMSHYISLVYKNHANYHFLEQSLLFQKHI